MASADAPAAMAGSLGSGRRRVYVGRHEAARSVSACSSASSPAGVAVDGFIGGVVVVGLGGVVVVGLLGGVAVIGRLGGVAVVALLGGGGRRRLRVPENKACCPGAWAFIEKR